MQIQGLITDERNDIDPEVRPFARKANEISRQGLKEGASLVQVVSDLTYCFARIFESHGSTLTFPFTQLTVLETLT